MTQGEMEPVQDPDSGQGIPDSESGFGAISARLARFYRILPLVEEDGVLLVAGDHADPAPVEMELRALLGQPVRIVPTAPAEIEAGLRERFGLGSSHVEGLDQDGRRPLTLMGPRVQELDDPAKTSSVVGWVNEILLQAYKDRATDVHFEPFEGNLRVRYRIDGVLYSIPVPALVMKHQDAVVSRVKVMANLDLGEKRLPQDGRIKAKVGDADLDLRISVLPTLHGEAVNVRLLNKSTMLTGLEELGLAAGNLQTVKQTLSKPYGVILVTGPTGSGKTTTLYASLCLLRSTERKILTIEDPVEYELDDITQIQVNSNIGLSFSTGLRSILRHDPDIMMVGEVRDTETAEVTVQVALTGHLVFSTVHTNDAASAVTRLLNMGIEPYLLSSCLQCIIAQRLVRVLCPHCKREAREDLALTNGLAKVGPTYEAVGCPQCKSIGYHGRTGIFEILPVDDDIKDLVLARVPAGKIKEAAAAKGMTTLRKAGLEKAAAGVTSLAEVLRVTQADGRAS